MKRLSVHELIIVLNSLGYDTNNVYPRTSGRWYLCLFTSRPFSWVSAQHIPDIAFNWIQIDDNYYTKSAQPYRSLPEVHGMADGGEVVVSEGKIVGSPIDAMVGHDENLCNYRLAETEEELDMVLCYRPDEVLRNEDYALFLKEGQGVFLSIDGDPCTYDNCPKEYQPLLIAKPTIVFTRVLRFNLAMRCINGISNIYPRDECEIYLQRIVEKHRVKLAQGSIYFTDSYELGVIPTDDMYVIDKKHVGDIPEYIAIEIIRARFPDTHLGECTNSRWVLIDDGIDCGEYIQEYASQFVRTIPAGTVVQYDYKVFPLARPIEILCENLLPQEWIEYDILRHYAHLFSAYLSTLNAIVISSPDDNFAPEFCTGIIPTQPTVFDVYTVKEGTFRYHHALPELNIHVCPIKQQVYARYIMTYDHILPLNPTFKSKALYDVVVVCQS